MEGEEEWALYIKKIIGRQRLPMWDNKDQSYRLEQIIWFRWDKIIYKWQVTRWEYTIHKLCLHHINAFHWIVLEVPDAWVFYFIVWSEQEYPGVVYRDNTLFIIITGSWPCAECLPLSLQVHSAPFFSCSVPPMAFHQWGSLAFWLLVGLADGVP